MKCGGQGFTLLLSTPNLVFDESGVKNARRPRERWESLPELAQVRDRVVALHQAPRDDGVATLTTEILGSSDFATPSMMRQERIIMT